MRPPKCFQRLLSVNPETSRPIRCLDCGFFGTHIADITDPGIVKLLENIPLELQRDWAASIGRIEEVTPLGRYLLSQSNVQPHDPQWSATIAGLDCARSQWPSKLSPMNLSPPQIHSRITTPQACSAFFPYAPGLSPDRHFELLLEANRNQTLRIISVRTALIGAGAALFGAAISAIAVLIAAN